VGSRKYDRGVHRTGWRSTTYSIYSTYPTYSTMQGLSLAPT